MEDASPTVPENTKPARALFKPGKPIKKTPCGYAAGGLRASDGTRYQVKATGQIVREGPPKMSKAELKRQKKARRQAKR